MSNTSPLRISYIGFLSALFLIVATNSTYAITGGVDDDQNTYDNVFMIGISARNDSQSDYIPQTICSGILIHKQVVLTAGHCIDFIETLEGFVGPDNVLVEVFVGYDQRNSMPDTEDGIPIDKHIIHPDYWWGPTSNPYDIGVLIFDDPNSFSGIIASDLPETGFLDGLKSGMFLRSKSRFTVVGYGCTVDWPPPVTNLFDSFIRRYAESSYRALLPAWLRLSINRATGDAGSCPGDSGGPIFWTDPENGHDTLVAITSWGDPNHIATSFNYRVDTSEALDFINGVIESLH